MGSKNKKQKKSSKRQEIKKEEVQEEPTTTTKTKKEKEIPLMDELLDHNGFFDHIVDMIPAKLYIPGESGDDYNPNPRFYKNPNADSKETRKAQHKLAKRRKFDPALSETTTKKIHNKLHQDDDDDSSDDENDIEEEEEEEENEPRKNGISPSPSSNGNNNNGNKSRIDILREKLHAKIAEKQGNRPTDPNTVSKRAARRAEKLRRKEEAIARNKRKLQQTTKAGGATTAQFQAKKHMQDDTDPTQDLATMDYGTITGLNQEHLLDSNYTKTNKSLANLSKKKNLQRMLEVAQQKKDKLESLKQSQDEKDQKEYQKIQWKDTLGEASGQRVKEDPAKIKKKMKQKEAKKKKSQKAWKSRLQEQQKHAKERQQIRNHNLAQRKLGGSAGANLSKKSIDKGDEKKKQSRPGFEGKKKEFINNKKQ